MKTKTAKGVTGEKRKRGRPRKPVYAPGQPTIEFRALPPGPPDKDSFRKLVAWHRSILESHQFLGLEDKSGNLTAWTTALADALEAGDAYRIAFYAKHAMKELAIQVMHEPFRSAENKYEPLLDLAHAGISKKIADKKRGKSVKFARYLRG